jgi:tetratricopeptide (TPR) repeat protein
VGSPLIDQGLAALRDGDAVAARRAFELALAQGESGAALEGLGEALYLECEYVASAAHDERAYSLYRRDRQAMAAGRAARTLAWITGNVLGQWAVRSEWLARARTILAEAGQDRPERGWLLIINAFTEPDAQARETLLGEAIAIGRRFGDPDIEFLALAYLGGLLVMTDRVQEGLALSDEALAALCAGEPTELATVDEIFCGLLWACELVNDVPRADQWMRATAERLRRSNVVAACCRAHYGGILTAAGRWQEAEVELLAAVRHFDQGMSGRRAAVLVQGLEQHPDVVPTLAALHLARGEVALARDLLERATQQADQEVPTVGASTMLGPLLALLVDVYLDQGSVETPRGSPGAWAASPRASAAPISWRPPPSPRAGSAWPPGRGTRAPGCIGHWKASRGPSCPWRSRGPTWSWPGRRRNAHPRSPSPKPGRHCRTSNGWRRLATPTRPGRCCARWGHPSGPAPRGPAH